MKDWAALFVPYSLPLIFAAVIFACWFVEWWRFRFGNGRRHGTESFGPGEFIPGRHRAPEHEPAGSRPSLGALGDMNPAIIELNAELTKVRAHVAVLEAQQKQQGPKLDAVIYTNKGDQLENTHERHDLRPGSVIGIKCGCQREHVFYFFEHGKIPPYTAKPAAPKPPSMVSLSDQLKKDGQATDEIKKPPFVMPERFA